MKTIAHYFFLASLTVFAGVIIATYSVEFPTSTAIATIKKVKEVKTVIEERGELMNIGAFSDVECGSAWCNKHEPKNGQIALNLRKWPGVKKVYVPVYDKYYHVVGNTYSETGNHYDMEIWFGNDRDAALQFGNRKLLVYIIE